MSSAELMTLLSISGYDVRMPVESASAMGAAATATPSPLSLTAEDMVTKVYGVLDTRLSKDECIAGTRQRLSLEPDDDESALWLESTDGYRIDYYGMRPDVAALARFDNNRVCDFCYFFLFPYVDNDDADSVANVGMSAGAADDNPQRTEFCGSMLQEMHDCGMDLGTNVLSDDLFEVVGGYKGNFIDMRLIDDPAASRYVLILAIEPDAL